MPEETTVLSADQQMEALHSELAGHPAFRRLRGILWQSLGDLLDHRRENKSPTAARRDMQQFGNDLSWAQGLMARLERDGYMVAASELSKALRYRDHRMAGETVRVEETVPITVIAYRPDTLLPFMSWLQIFERHEDDFRLAARKADGAHPGLLQFFRTFPVQAVHLHDASTEGYSVLNDLLSWYRLHVFGPRIHPLAQKLRKPGPVNHSKWLSLRLHMKCYHEGRLNGTGACDPILMWCFRRPMKDVLSTIPRDEQQDWAMWQIDLPAIYDDQRALNIGIHPEAEHQMWRRRYPSLVSHGLQHGFGAIVMPHDLVEYKHDDINTPEGKYVRYCLRGGRMFF